MQFLLFVFFASADAGNDALRCNSQASLDGLEDFCPKICL